MSGNVLEYISAVALFFDDARIEVTGKTIFIGQYIGDMFLSPQMPTDRLAIVFLVRWPRDYTPKSMSLRIEVPGQPVSRQPVTLPTPDQIKSLEHFPAPFDRLSTQMIAQIRFPPLRVGDIIDAWVEIDGSELPAGRLRVKNYPADWPLHFLNPGNASLVPPSS